MQIRQNSDNTAVDPTYTDSSESVDGSGAW